MCLHGFTGTPFEVLPLAEVLRRAGHDVSTPLLPGHGSDIAALAQSTWHDWAAAADDAVNQLVTRTGGPVGIVGASMGGLLAIHVARRRPVDVAALALLAPSLRLRRVEAYGLAVLLRAARLARMTERVVIPKAFGADVRDAGIRAQIPMLRQYPLRALSTLSELMDSVAADLEHVVTPVLLVHGRHDRTVPRAVIEEAAAGLRSCVVERLDLPRSGHLLALDYDRVELADAVLDFLTRQARATPTASPGPQDPPPLGRR